MAAAAPPRLHTGSGPAGPGLSTQQLSFIDRLEAKLASDPPRQKGLRTRERLKIACARLLDRAGFHNLKAGDVSSEAGLSEGSFYLYFTDKRDITRTVLDEFQLLFFGLEPGSAADPQRNGPFDPVRAANRLWFAYARANAGLLRCLYQFADEDPLFAAEVQRHNMRWHERVMRATLRQTPGSPLSDVETLLLVSLLGGMMDDLSRRLIVYPDRELIALLESLGADDATLGDVASLIWFRILRPAAPMPEGLQGSVERIAAALFPQPK